MSSKKPLQIDMIAGSQLRDTQGEMLSVEGADISDLEAGCGRFNDNHGKGFYNSIGRVTGAKKIFSKDDCTEDRHHYYWDKVKAPFIYVKGYLYDDEEHPNAKAAAAILRNISKSDMPLKIKASVEGGVIARGIKDPNLLARTKIHSVALTFTPANQATLVEAINLQKSTETWSEDKKLIKSVEHLAVRDIPSFKHVKRQIHTATIIDNFRDINRLALQLGLNKALPEYQAEELIKRAAAHRLVENIKNINRLIEELSKAAVESSHFDPEHMKKALTAGYGGASAPTGRTHGAVLQTEVLDSGRGFDYFVCQHCGKEQIYAKNQVKCRNCQKSLPLEQVRKFIFNV